MRIVKKIIGVFFLIFMMQLGVVAMESPVNIRCLQGQEIISCVEEITEVGLTVLREYPYFFEGTPLEYIECLQMCIDSQHGLVMIAEQNGKIMGILWGAPIVDYTPDLIEMFSLYGITPNSLFYIAGFAVLQEHRHKGIGYALYRKLEEAVRKQGIYSKMTYCEVIQSSDVTPPEYYQSLDSYAIRAGFIKYPDIICHWSWKEIGMLKAIEHPLVFWIKNL